MTKKSNSMFKKILSTTLMIAMLLSLSMHAFALNYSMGINAENPAQAAITKILKMPKGTNTPAYSFKFDFKAIDIDGNTSVVDNMPLIPSVVVDFADEGTITETVIGTIYVAKSSEDFLAKADFSEGPEGVYRYLVTEDVTTVNLSDHTKENIVYSKAQYYIDVYVAYDTEAKTYFAKYANGVTIEGYIDEWYDEDTEGGEKLNPSPGGLNQEEGITIDDDYSQVVFTNRYWKTTGGGENGEDPDYSSLSIKKELSGNIIDNDKLFVFSVTVTTPEVVIDNNGNAISRSYKAYIMNSSGPVDVTLDIDTSSNRALLSNDSNGYFYVLKSGVLASNIQLKNGEWLAFVDLEVGAKVAVTENAEINYKPSYVRSFAGAGITYTALRGNMEWGFPRPSDDIGPHFTEEGSGSNFNLVTFINVHRTTTPTGIIVDNLPYVVLLGIIILAIAGYIFIKVRKGSGSSSV